MAKKKKKQEEASSDMTVVMFVALMILLLAFFIVLVSMSSIEEKKKKDVLASLNSTFGAMPGGRSPFFDVGGVLTKASEPLTSVEADYRQIKELAYDTLGEDKVRLLSDGGRRTIILQSEILFGAEGVSLKPEALPFLKGLAAIIELSPYWIEVGGYTDDVEPGPTSPAKDNWTLSALRALAVLKYLQFSGVGEERLAAYGYGSLNPVKPNTSARNRALNHRVEIALDQNLAARVEALRLLKSPGRANYRGFSFDLMNQPEPGSTRPAEEAPAEERN